MARPSSNTSYVLKNPPQPEYTIETEIEDMNNTGSIRKEEYRGYKMECHNPHCYWSVQGMEGYFTGRLEATLAVDADIASKAMLAKLARESKKNIAIEG